MDLLIKCPRFVLHRFKRQAKAAYPYETYALLLGHKSKGIYLIEELYTPPDVADHCTEDYVEMQDHWMHVAMELAREEGWVVLGDSHSHPRQYKSWKGMLKENTPSKGDFECGWGGLGAICAVAEQKDGRLRASVAFYGPMPTVSVVVT